MSAIIDGIDAVIAICDGEKKILMINQAGRTMLMELVQMDAEEMIGYKIDEVLEPFIDDGISIVATAAEKMAPVKKNVRYVIEDRSIDKAILYTAMPLIEDGELKYIIVTGRDMTQLILIEEQLSAAEKLNEFYSVMVKSLAGKEVPERIIHSSKRMEATLSLAARASKSDASVFITGESGVGKEEIAKYIHHNSARAEKPYVAVNCAAIPRELIESELFGFVEGAFTGSKRGGKAGLIEEADGGTFFLDEVGDLPFDVQSKLLRVIQEGVLRRIGSNRDKNIDVRYICATNLSPEKLLDNSVFRQDLLYRLSVIPINVPPIRERREDIIPLIENFLSMYNKKYSRSVHLSAAAYSYLCCLPWRGNVRQIKNVVERIVILSEDGTLLKEDVIPILKLDIESEDSSESDSVVRVIRLSTLGKAQEEMERQLIGMAVEKYKTVPKAAEALGVPPSTIYRKLKK